MNIYNFIQDKSHYFVISETDNRYLPLLIFILSATVLTVILTRLFLSIFLKKFIKEENKLSEKIAKKIKNLASVSIVFLSMVMILIMFLYDDGILWRGTFKVIITIFIIYFTFATISIGKVVLSLLSYRKNAHFITQQTLPLFQNTSNIVIVLFVVYIIFAFVWGVDMTALLASLGIVGVALSFAARDTIANFLSGIFIMADQPYKVGDFIDLDTGERGEVIDIGIRSTRILTVDEVEIIIPNSIMGNTPVINESGGPSRNTRIGVDVNVAYGTNIFLVKNILNAVARKSEYVMQNPAPITRFVEFGESGIHLKLLFWIKEASKKGIVVDELNTWIYEELNKANIEIPYKKQDLYIKEIQQKQDLL